MYVCVCVCVCVFLYICIYMHVCVVFVIEEQKLEHVSFITKRSRAYID